MPVRTALTVLPKLNFLKPVLKSRPSLSDALPTELLIETFAYAAAVDPGAPISLVKVCRLWRRICLSSPRVWQYISLSDRRPVARSQAQARLWINRSSPLPFFLHLDVQDNNFILPLLSPCLSVMDRWGDLTIAGYQSISFADNLPFANDITRLSISIQADFEILEASESLMRDVFTERSPIWPDQMIMSLALPQLPSPLTLHPLRFTSIHITEEPLSAPLDPISLLQFLTACPELEEFSFTGCNNADASPNPPSFIVVYLPHLVTLELKTTLSVRTILSSIDCPNLEALYLSMLNVDLIQDAEDDEEDGGSTGDFSHSPWSDKATGQGLRRLLARSNPPLRVLEMNFSDLRTKDFEYVFDRTPQLEEFVIVASDMSDTVIQLLKPVTREDGAQLRLPNLRCLELYNCNRISGDVTVDVLTSRSPNALPSNGLEELAIVECLLVEDKHLQLLREEFGPRLKAGRAV